MLYAMNTKLKGMVHSLKTKKWGRTDAAAVQHSLAPAYDQTLF